MILLFLIKKKLSLFNYYLTLLFNIYIIIISFLIFILKKLHVYFYIEYL